MMTMTPRDIGDLSTEVAAALDIACSTLHQQQMHIADNGSMNACAKVESILQIQEMLKALEREGDKRMRQIHAV